MPKAKITAPVSTGKQKNVDRLVKAIRAGRVRNYRQAAEMLDVSHEWVRQLINIATAQGVRVVKENGKWVVLN